MSAPCMNCKKRELGCHSSCEEYLNYKAEIERIKAIRGWDREQQQYFGSLSVARRKGRKKYKSLTHKR